MLTACFHMPQLVQLPDMLDLRQVPAWPYDELLEDRAILNPNIHAQTPSKLVLYQ